MPWHKSRRCLSYDAQQVNCWLTVTSWTLCFRTKDSFFVHPDPYLHLISRLLLRRYYLFCIVIHNRLIIMSRRPRSSSPSEVSLPSQISFASSTSSASSSSSGQKGGLRSYLFIFVILWFSSLQITLFVWNEIPFAVLSPGVLPRINNGTLQLHWNKLGKLQ